MSAHEQMRLMLDELMGTCRNGEDQRKKKLMFYSSEVCKSFLLNSCPYDILSATRCGLGECPKVHDVALRADYESARKKEEYYFEEEAVKQLRNFIAESERRTQVAKLRLAGTQEMLNAKEAFKLQKTQILADKIDETLSRAEHLGINGNLEESLKLLEEAEKLKKEKEKAEANYRKSSSSTVVQQQLKLRVCEVCSSYLGMNDNDKRLADHFNGKLHLGFMHIREKLEELEGVIEERHISRVLDNEFSQREMHSSRSRSRSPCFQDNQQYKKLKYHHDSDKERSKYKYNQHQ
ncbi:putative RNA-binding protein Luc7-like 2 [Uloborus diversus]|uniref:putative RNA-binding protein Luc7-like 2 n=1 Tax=Uloborus diversus TaxID=327109 RepID=UPI002409F818|nr:putative RNA-binding protein Luc7-like 2 [Uloborus diversus]